MNIADSDIISFSNLRLDLASRKLFVGRTQVPLRNKEFSLIEYFLKNVGKVRSRTQILEDVWDRNILCPTNTVDVHVGVLRRKLKKYLSANLIKTVHCIGYILD